MSYKISNEPDSPLEFTPEHHYVRSVDSPGNNAGDPAGAKSAAQEVQEADSHESAQARLGASWAIESGTFKGHGAPFSPSVGLHSTGPDHRSSFEEAVRRSGGVRQGSSWCSDAAPGVQRIVCDHSLTLDKLSKPDEGKGLQDQGSGHTFESQRHSHWSHDRWGG